MAFLCGQPYNVCLSFATKMSVLNKNHTVLFDQRKTYLYFQAQNSDRLIPVVFHTQLFPAARGYDPGGSPKLLPGEPGGETVDHVRCDHNPGQGLRRQVLP